MTYLNKRILKVERNHKLFVLLKNVRSNLYNAIHNHSKDAQHMLYHLTYGRNTPTGRVSDLDWQMYCQEVLDSNFDGYTITDAVGTWKSDLEDTKIVIINTTNQDKVEDVAWHYKDMFDQEAVGHYTTSPMEFI